MPEPNTEPEESGLLPARMLNEYAYCPRLFHLEHVDGLFAESADTAEGTSVHRVVDRKDEPLPEAGGEEPPAVARSVLLASERLGIVAKMDLVETAGDEAIPIDTKKGKAPSVPEGAWEPERVQLCAQGLLLREHGFKCDYGYLWFAGSRRRVRINFDEALVSRTQELAEGARAAVSRESPPPPLEDSPKCPKCSLVGICLPDEVNLLRQGEASPAPRRLIAARDDRVPVYVQGNGLMVGKRGGSLVVSEDGKQVAEVPMKDVAGLSVFGNNQVTTPAVQALCQADISISWFSFGGWFYGVTRGMGTKNVHLRLEQFRAAEDAARRLAFARSFVTGKIANSRTLLMRNHPAAPKAVVDGLKAHMEAADRADSAESLLGLEGNAARLYFSAFSGMLKPRAGDELSTFDFRGRNRRPPKDPINSMLSLGYAMLCRDVTAALFAVGFDPFVGFFHTVRPGRPSLALDLMEEFRPIIVDSVAITVANNGEASPTDFITGSAGCMMKPGIRKRFLSAYERRMNQMVTHPVFGYRLNYRRVLELQARLLGACLAGEFETYPAFRTR